MRSWNVIGGLPGEFSCSTGCAGVPAAVVTHLLARPVPGIGIAMPMLLPPVLAAIVALLLDRQHAAPLAYIAGSVGTLL
jgi:uncharacterized membrane protein